MVTLELEHLLIVGLIIIVIAVLSWLTLALRKTLDTKTQVDILMQEIKENALAVVDVPVKVSIETAQQPVITENAEENAEERRKRVKEIATNFEEMKKKSPTKIVTTDDYSIMEGEVPIYHNGELHKPKVVIMNPGKATPEETMELMEFARSKFVKEEEE